MILVALLVWILVAIARHKDFDVLACQPHNAHVLTSEGDSYRLKDGS